MWPHTYRRLACSNGILMLPETTNYVQTGSLFSRVEPGQVEVNLEVT